MRLATSLSMTLASSWTSSFLPEPGIGSVGTDLAGSGCFFLPLAPLALASAFWATKAGASLGGAASLPRTGFHFAYRDAPTKPTMARRQRTGPTGGQFDNGF